MNDPPNDLFCDTAIEKAVDHIRAGQLIAFPTETVYGLGADATNASAVATIFAVKDRPSFNPLIIHVANLQAAEELVIFDDRARALTETCWPGPLTVAYPVCQIVLFHLLQVQDSIR